jgi:SOS-response transcriptional repressor LexA
MEPDPFPSWLDDSLVGHPREYLGEEVKIKPFLTKTQQSVLDYLKFHLLENQGFPTLREINEKFGWTSPNAPYSHIRALALKDYLELTPGKKRTYKIKGIRLRLEEVP